ncbi:keratin, type II cytoskeletal I [Olea europaea subsp. europaea]|uniref:Keratin, type II cytoskeletal I n=1 Tax=Olea europaea subsp. europaea TaxID=158383 RepID=A0A8S0SPM6_OLEEU|nr:keratin, type II cytoskeletal I [Olea europaea subsp. europaea]
MRDNVINLKVVLANGDIIKTGSRARKSAAGNSNGKGGHYHPTLLWIFKRQGKGINFQTGKPENKLSEFFKESGRKLEDSILGPGIGAGIGCGIGLGMGMAGGAGFDGSPRNHLKMVLGIGFGCGIGVGFGYGQGIIGGGVSYESLKSHLFA